MPARFFVAFVLLLMAIRGMAQQQRFSFSQQKMGSPFSIVFYTGDSNTAARLAAECYQLVDSFNLIFSDYIDTSELEQLSASAANAPVHISAALSDILLLSKNAFDKSGGAFDVTIGPLVKLWRQSRKSQKLPGKKAVRQALHLTGFNKVRLDTAGKKVSLQKAGMQLDLGGIAKGWIAQRVIDLLKTRQVTRALVNAGGDIVVSDAPPGSPGWSVGVNVPETTDELLPKALLLQNKAVATSGDAYQYLQKNGKKYSHIIDPRTGYAVTSRRNVTVIARDGATADWLATACSIVDISRAIKMAEQSGAELLIAEIKNGKIIFHTTRGFARYWKQPQQ